MRNFFAATLLLGISAFSAPAIAADQTIIVLDGSGSMWGQIDGKTKIEIARETLGTVLQSVPADKPLGLMVYGHREKGLCSDIELAVPPRTGSGEDIMAFAEKINPKGKTPLSDAVRQAAEAMKYTEDKATVVLVTDGLETCEADPCALASELEANGIDFTAHVVGFGLTEEEGKQVACLAENTGGKFVLASDAGQLATALETTVAAAEPEPEPAPKPEPAKPEFNVVTDAYMFEGGPSLGDNTRVRWDFFAADSDGKPTGDSIEGGYGAVSSFNLEPGSYAAVARLATLETVIPVEATADSTVTPVANFNAGELTVVPKRTPDSEADDSARIDLEFGSNGRDGGYGPDTYFVAAGDVKISGRIGPANAKETVTIAPGEKKSHDLIIGSGVVVTKAVYAEGGPEVEASGIRFDVVKAKKDINGDRENVTGGYGVDDKLDVPPGELVLLARLGSASGETPFTIKAGESMDVIVNINGGVLAITAPGAYRIDIVGAKKDIQGNRKDISGSYGEEYQDTVPPGDYIVRVEYEGDKAPAEKPATVTAGERTEISVE